VKEIKRFQATIWDFYREHGRHDLLWRLPEIDGSSDPYKILVSEVMLQQTQVPRVMPKFEQFMTEFPNTNALAHAPLAEVLAVWNGLGYNRRAKFLWQAAQMIERDFGGEFPHSVDQLQKLPGIGVNTAGAIVAYSFNQPAVFVETNVRTVFIHHFFKDESAVADKIILDMLTETLDRENPREFYWALMDYGTHLKQTVGNASRASKTYAKQSQFEGSRRQLRGAVVRELLAHPRSFAQMAATLSDSRLEQVLADLAKEGLIRQDGGLFVIR
jgi:A/G-specific adenine glycosylase